MKTKTPNTRMKKTFTSVALVVGLVLGSTGAALATPNSGNKCGPGEAIYWYTAPGGNLVAGCGGGEGEPVGTVMPTDTVDKADSTRATAKAVDGHQG